MARCAKSFLAGFNALMQPSLMCNASKILFWFVRCSKRSNTGFVADYHFSFWGQASFWAVPQPAQYKLHYSGIKYLDRCLFSYLFRGHMLSITDDRITRIYLLDSWCICSFPSFSVPLCMVASLSAAVVVILSLSYSLRVSSIFL